MPEPPLQQAATMAQNEDATEKIAVDLSNIQTEDGAPTDNLFAEREARLLVETLYASWKPNAPFLACDNVGARDVGLEATLWNGAAQTRRRSR